MRRASILLALGLALSACGGAAHHGTTQATAARTLTISAAQATAQGRCVSAEGASSKPTSPRCARLLSAPYLAAAIACGHGLYTNGSCLFAKRVHSAYETAAFGSQQNAAVAGGEVNVTVTGTPVACLLQRPGVRRCKSRISQVWVQFTAA